MGCFSLFSVLILTVVISLHGQISLDGICRADGSGAFVSLEVTNGDGKYVQILGCATQVGPLSGSPATVDMVACPLTWDVGYQVYVKDTSGVIQGSDHHIVLNCSRNVDKITLFHAFTVRPGVPRASITDSVAPEGEMLITDDTQDWDGTPLSAAAIGDHMRIHMFLTAPFQGSFGIVAIRITVSSSAGSVDLVQGGCQVKSWFSHVRRIRDAILWVEFNAFMLTLGTQTYDDQVFEALLEVCAGSCPPVDCSAAPYGPGQQNGRRRRRAVSNDTMIVKGNIRVSPFQLDTKTDVDTNVNEGQTAKVEECEVCMQKSVMYGVTTVLVLALILSLAVSCFLFIRVRKSRKILREDSEMNGSANRAYRR